ncbi:MAG: caspase family protein [Candidatus Accumulibacter sp.]|uniref:caspase family protein n=1 Tax=Accumulibacter sp. TaxID=2053492 RepID=UPI00287A3821|nr:caspase family protein [Accumulibacter sp.]MDS4014838.1 caspase family protein [Accumulibacter sp.]
MPFRHVIRALHGAFIVAGCLLAAGSVAAGEPDNKPILRLEAGMHSAAIQSVATDAQGRWTVTAAEDKTARVWEVASGKLLSVLRPPQDVGNEGKLYAAALTPDGKTVALAGWTGWDWEGKASIYLFDRASGQLRGRISGLPSVVRFLAYSPDGRWLATGLGGTYGLRVFEVTSGKLIDSDANYGEQTSSLAFSRDGKRLLTSSDDRKLRLYRIESAGRLQLMRSVEANGGQRPFAAQFSPDGTRIAVGFSDTRTVQVIDGTKLTDVARANTMGIDTGTLSSLTWSEDGRRLYAAGRWGLENRSMLRRWPAGDWQSPHDLPLEGELLTALLPLPKGDLFYAAAGPAWGVLTASGTLRVQHATPIADLRNASDQILIAPDGKRVRFNYRLNGKEARTFDLASRSLTEDAARLITARTTSPELLIYNWRNQSTPKLDRRALELAPSETARCLAIAEGSAAFVLGTDRKLRLFGRDGSQIWERSSAGGVWAVNISADARYVVAAYGDGTIRWHRLRDGNETLAFYPHSDRKRWIVWTPEGFFASSGTDADGLIGYHINRGRDQTSDFVSAAQLRERFYRPALLSRRLDIDGDTLLAEAVGRFGDARQLLARGDGRVPTLELLSPSDVYSNKPFEVRFKLVDGGSPIERVIYRIDGVEIEMQPASGGSTGVLTRTLDLLPGRHQVLISAVNRLGLESLPLRVNADVLAGSLVEPTLHVLAIGIANYRDATLASTVRFPADDAQAIARRLREQGAAHYRQVNVQTLLNERATRDGIRAALAEMAGKVQPQDVFVVYLAGHGRIFDGDYHFIPYDAQGSAEGLRKRSVSHDDLRRLLARIRSLKSIALLDTCSAGLFGSRRGGRIGEEKDALERLGRLTGRSILAATADDRMALEGEGRHGAFAYTLLEGLAGKPDRHGNRLVDVRGLAAHVQEHFAQLARKNWGYDQRAFTSLASHSFALFPAR